MVDGQDKLGSHQKREKKKCNLVLCTMVPTEDRLADLLLDKAPSCSVQLRARLPLPHLGGCKQPRVS